MFAFSLNNIRANMPHNIRQILIIPYAFNINRYFY